MHCRLIQERQPRTWVVIFEAGEDPVEQLHAFAREHLVATCHFTAIGAFERAVLGYFDVETQAYRRIPVDEQVEVLALTGNITDSEDETDKKVHAHVVLGASDGRALGGHLLEAKVRPTLELVLTEAPAHLQRHEDPQTHLPLIGV